MKVCELLLEYSRMDYDSKKGHMTGDVKRWLASAEIKTGDKEFFKNALALLKKTDAWKELEKTNLKYVGTERELANGTLSFYDGDFSQYKNVTGNSGRYKIYGNGQIRTDVPTAPTRLKSPKPRMVVGNPMKSMVSTWENSLWELLNKYKKRIKKAGSIKEENESIPRDIRRAAMQAGYDINSKSLRTITALKVEYAKRSLESDYADQFDAKLGELLGMIDMNEKQLKDFVKNNG